MHKIDANKALNPRVGGQSESFKSDGQLKLSQIEKQLIDMQEAYPGANSAMNLGQRGTQEELEQNNNNNLSIILVGDHSMNLSQAQKNISYELVIEQQQPKQHVNYWVDE